MTIDFQPYLTSICADAEDNELQHLYTPTDALSRQLQPAKKSRFPNLQLQVQTVPPPQREGQAPEREQIERFNVLEGLRKYTADYNHVLLVGRPGSGKSTALQRLLWEEAQTHLAKLDKIPVLVELRQYTTSTLDLIHNFIKRHKLNIEKTAIEKLLDENRLLLLFDGVNELPNETARQDLNTFRQNHPQTSMIFTTRDLGVGGDLGIEKKLEMQPLTQTQMQQFVRAHLPDTGEEMLRCLGEKLQSFAQTPLLLLMLCAVFVETGDIPANLGLVFRSFAQSYNSKFWDSVQVSDEFRRWIPELLQHLAFTMMQGESPTEFRLAINEQEAKEILTKFLEGKVDYPPSKARAWLEELLKHHLIQYTSNKKIEFRHQLLQEYYAAECLLPQIKNLSDAKLKRDYLNYLKWTEPLALMLALLDNEAQAVRVVKLALDVDLMLGARLAGEVKTEFQKETINLVNKLELPNKIKIIILGKTRSNIVINILIKNIEHEEKEIRQLTTSALGEIATNEAVSALLLALKDKDTTIRGNTADLLGHIGNLSAVPALQEALKDESPYVMVRADYALLQMGIEYELSMFKKIFPDEEVYTNNESRKNKEYRDILVMQALYHHNIHFREQAIRKLRRFGDKSVVPIFIKLLYDKDSSIRMRATQALEVISTKEAIPALIKVMKDEYSLTRISAVSALIKIGGESIIDALIEALKDQDRRVRSKSVKALGNIKSSKAINGLALVLQHDKDDYIRYSAAEALGEICDETAVSVLILALGDDSYFVRKYSAEALGKIGSSLAKEYLLSLVLNDENPDVCVAAANALGQVADSELISFFYNLLKTNEKTFLIETISAIQRRSKIYNHQVFCSPLSEEENNTDPFLDILNKLITMSETPKYDFRGSNIGNFADTIQSGGKQETVQHNYAPEQKPNLAEAAKEIQQLLAQLAQKNPTIVQSQNNDVVLETIHQEIKRNPTIKARLLNALKSGGTEALKVALDAIFKNPIVSVSVETIKGFIEAE